MKPSDKKQENIPRQQLVKVVVRRDDFINWRWNRQEDFEDLALSIIERLLKGEDAVTVSLKEEIENSGYLPEEVIENFDELPKEILDESREEIEAMCLCDFEIKR